MRGFVVVQGENITDYLYGYSSRISLKGKYLGKADLEAIQEEIRLHPSFQKYGVFLTIIEGKDIKPGMLLMSLSLNGGTILKGIDRVSGITNDPNGDDTVHLESKFPEYYEGNTGFTSRRFVDESLNNNYPTLYLRYHGKIPKREPNQLSHYDKIMWYATDFKLLVECWALAHSQNLRDSPSWSHDSYHSIWYTEFRNKHGSRFQHDLVSSLLDQVLYEGDMRGLHKIYDDRNMWSNKDLITPLLVQMQNDIVHRLLEDPDMVSFLFGENAGSYWNRRLSIILDKLYAPSQMVYVGVAASASAQTPYNEALLERLSKIIQQSHYEGERQAARKLIAKLTGRAFQ